MAVEGEAANNRAVLRGGLVGCGYFGKFQVEGWGRVPGARLVATCDRDLDRAGAHSDRAYPDAAAMLAAEKLDFLDIATREDTHAELLELAAAAGLAVICQKPMARTWAEALAMVERAERDRVPFMVHENWRWQPWYRAAKRLLDDGAVGTPLAYTFRTRCGDGLGPEPYQKQRYMTDLPRFLIHEVLVHHIDTARFLFGDVARVFAEARRVNPITRAEDQALLALTHGSGLLGCIDGNRFVDPDPEGPVMGDLVVEGDRGTLRIANSGHVFVNAERAWTNDVANGYRGDSVRATQAHFVDCLRSRRPFESGGRAYLSTVAVVEAAYRSVAERRGVAIAELLAGGNSP